MSDTPNTEQDIVDAGLEIEATLAADPEMTLHAVAVSLWIRAAMEE
jgi:hypothetical protein